MEYEIVEKYMTNLDKYKIKFDLDDIISKIKLKIAQGTCFIEDDFDKNSTYNEKCLIVFRNVIGQILNIYKKHDKYVLQIKVLKKEILDKYEYFYPLCIGSIDADNFNVKHCIFIKFIPSVKEQ